jgi:hypothetical protein
MSAGSQSSPLPSLLGEPRRAPASRYLAVATALAAAGALFSGYLSWIKMSSGVCAFSEPCPMFLGQPACYFGFALFVAMLVLTGGAFLLRLPDRWPLIANTVVASGGVVFAGTLTAGEVMAHAGLPVYGLGLPTCAYGAAFFLAILVYSAATRWRHRHPRP